MRFLKQTLLLILLSFITLIMQAQSAKYDSLWKKVDDLSGKKGLTKSALAEVDKIYALAKKEKQDAQMIKALVYKMQLNEQVDEAGKAGIALLEAEISTAKEPVKSILNSLLAGQYLNYFQQHRYQFYDRTQTVGFQKDDIATWSIGDFHAKIAALFLASAEDRKLLQQTGLQAYEPVIIKGNMRSLRPTLYDLLANKALDYFRNDERDIDKPAYAFEIRDDTYFSDAAAFSKLKLETRDTLSLHQKALHIYQQLLLFHANDAKPDALIDADLGRIQFVQQFGVMENKPSLYLNALQRVAGKWGDLPAAAQAWYMMAREYADKAGSYQPFKDTSNQYAYVEAVRICEKVVQQKEESEGKTNCLNLLKEIRRGEISLTTEAVNVPGQPFRALVNYRNFTGLNLRIIPFTDQLRAQDQNHFEDAYWKQLIAAKPVRSWKQSLPSTTDFQKHSVEIKIDPLPVGSYMIIGSVNESFSLGQNNLSAQVLFVSNISYVNNRTNYFLLDRETGKPLAKATVQVWANRYDYNARRYTFTRGEKLISDGHGLVKLSPQNARNENLQLEITYNSDHLFQNDQRARIYYSGPSTSNKPDAVAYEQTNSQVFFFTDRSIYRPGQVVYFKGIVITKDFTTKKSKVVTGHKAVVILHDANDQTTDSLFVTTNEFGSYSGKFTLPQNVLNGEFGVQEKGLNGSSQFSVEEYKRPAFYVEFETNKGAYKINDSITLTGSAKAYAGNNISEAQVSYRVVRRPRLIYSWLYRGWSPLFKEMEITNGTAVTDADGRFRVRFKALPDLSVSKAADPVFDYRVVADITDINGETRSGEKVVSVSYKALQISFSLSPDNETLTADSLRSLRIITKNINGEFQSSLVHVSVYQLQAPDRLIRKRYWDQPDQFVMKEAEFIQSFPFDEYRNETDYHTWTKGSKIWEKTDSVRQDQSFIPANSPMPQGSYLIEAVTKDKYGEEVKGILFIQVYDEKSSTLPTPAYLWSTQINSVAEPGESSTIAIGSSASDLFVIRQIDSSRSFIDPGGEYSTLQEGAIEYISLNQEKRSFVFTPQEKDRGGFGISYFFVKNNRFYSSDHTVLVPWTNKELNVSYTTFRDKTLPGSEEKWKLKISGYKSEKAAAELLAGMYDASLDQFRPHSWSKPYLWPTYSESYTWRGNENFASAESFEKVPEDSLAQFEKEYDRLLTPEINRYNRVGGYGYTSRFADVTMSMQDAAPPPAPAKGMRVLATVEKLQSTKINIVNQEGVQDEAAILPAVPENRVAVLPILPRKNFNETAFFFPDFHTDAEGNIEFSFTLPEALTRWKFQALAHTKELAFGYSTKDIVTQKELMVQPNVPRFLREGDHMELSTKVVNMTDKEITGTVHLELFDAATMKPVDGWFQNMTANQYFTVEAGKSVPALFTVQIPYQYNSAIVYRFTASAASGKDTVSDGEEALIPVLKNSMLVTESVPLPMRGNTAKNFRFDKLLQSGNSETLQQYALTVEYTSNPVWYAVQALPYLADYPYECAEQTFNRFYANALATRIATASPRLKAIFDQWRTAASGQDSAALLSNLQKNQELKSVLLEETPWVLQAKGEEQQKKNIAVLFDMNRMSAELHATLVKLKQFQLPNGGFPWFRGDLRDDRYITQYILTGIGHLKKLGAWPKQDSALLTNIVRPAIQYLDKRIKEDYDRILKAKSKVAGSEGLSSLSIQYLYTRSFFPDYGIPGESFTAVNYFRKQSQQGWLQQSRYMQGMIALSLYRTGDIKTAQDIIKSLQQNAITNEETGMYWKEVRSGYYWYQAPVETQSLLIEAFSEISKNEQIITDLTTWLLKQKQTRNWNTTKATADACYALLIGSPAQNGAALAALNNEPVVEIRLGDKSVKSTDQPQQAGTGYFKKTFDGPFVSPSMGDISVKIQQGSTKPMPSWGAVYWQYFENLDQIASSATALQLNKKLFIESNSDRGPVLQPVADGTVLHPGTKMKVRIELRVDRDMEYVHMKDMRASCMEPVNVLSSYKWQGGLGYYESTRDASTNFFFSWLPKGTYVFEYPLFVTHTGNFSNGITSIQCMYAPEFTSHSEGVRVRVEQ